MNSITKILFAAASITLSFAAQADTLKPMHGATYHAGTKHAAVYFLNHNAACKLVLTIADDTRYEPTRFEAAIGEGSSKRYFFAEGKALEFICGENNRDVEKLPGGHLVTTNVEAARALGIKVD